jgi:predicted ATPase
MATFVAAADVNILNGLLAGVIPFQKGLNIIVGENGTLKTKLLQEIKSGHFRASEGAPALLRIQAISPKRNSERRTAETLIQTLRQQNKTFDAYIQERGGAQIVDATFQNYPSLGELFFFVFERRSRDGGSQKDHMDSVTADLNSVMQEVFPDYKLMADWSTAMGAPRLRVFKRGSIEVPIDALSLGEQEVLSLITNLYASRESYDVYLIDEPEVHLNWHLEDRLFEYFDNFADRYGKQIIVATHSRAIFTERLLPKAIFLYWNAEGRIQFGKEIPSDQRRRIAGEAIEIIKIGQLPSRTFFVEDDEHAAVIKAISTTLNSQVGIVQCGNAPNVRSLFRQSKTGGEWAAAYFLEDGDNENTPFPGEPHFIHLSKYAIENFLLDFEIASSVTGKTQQEIREIILQAILANRDKILGKTKFLDFLIDNLRIEHLIPERLARLDASLIIQHYLRVLGLTFDEYLERYVSEAKRRNALATVFPPEIIAAIQEKEAGARTTTGA